MVIKAKAVGIENLNRSTIVAVKTLKGKFIYLYFFIAWSVKFEDGDLIFVTDKV